VTADEALAIVGRPDVALIDLRESAERERRGVIPGAIHLPYPRLQENIAPGGMLHELARSTSKQLLFYCAFGERSAMAVQAAQATPAASASSSG
ncbi:MBL fold metallo-hydrolase, partial [Mesorhizobium sp. M3A.F.Ca.ET.175.01.1.1]|uniref:rhodanese-like domain-containing protein n=1 Tax=Mesorhizobium sp. M3A.F.Ca.ET.175.01.1.1 TaxID=2563945 RepID=UPI00113F9A20